MVAIKLSYRIEDDAVKSLFVEKGSAQQKYEFQINWLDLNVEDRQLLVDVYGIQEEYNLSDMPRWRVGYTRDFLDGVFEYNSIFETVEELMSTAREVLKQAVSTASKAKYEWVMEKLNSYNEAIDRLMKWRKHVSNWSIEDRYEEYSAKVESLKTFSKVNIQQFPDNVLDEKGNNLTSELVALFEDYRKLVSDIKETQEGLYELCVFGEGIDTDIVYYNQRNAWIVQYGTDYLCSLVEQGYQYDDIYVKERLEREYPGWFVHTGHCIDTVLTDEQIEMAAPYRACIYEDSRGYRFMMIKDYLGKHNIAKWFDDRAQS